MSPELSMVLLVAKQDSTTPKLSHFFLCNIFLQLHFPFFPFLFLLQVPSCPNWSGCNFYLQNGH